MLRLFRLNSVREGDRGPVRSLHVGANKEPWGEYLAGRLLPRAEEKTQGPTIWRMRQRVSPMAAMALLECVAELAYALDEFQNIARANTDSAILLLVKIRQISVTLRKILLDGNGAMLKQCIDNPEMHPMQAPASNSKTLTAKKRFEKEQYTLNFEDGSSTKLRIPAYDYVVSVQPLFGISHESETSSILTMPFDLTGQGVKFNKWMTTNVLQVDEMQFDIRSLLRLLAAKEGAHSDPSPAVMGPTLPDESRDARYAAIDGVKFGLFSYMHFFALFTGLYLVARSREAVRSYELSSAEPGAEQACEVINHYPQEFPSAISCPVSIDTSPLYVLGEDLQLVGDYSRGISTTMRIP